MSVWSRKYDMQFLPGAYVIDDPIFWYFVPYAETTAQFITPTVPHWRVETDAAGDLKCYAYSDGSTLVSTTTVSVGVAHTFEIQYDNDLDQVEFLIDSSSKGTDSAPLGFSILDSDMALIWWWVTSGPRTYWGGNWGYSIDGGEMPDGTWSYYEWVGATIYPHDPPDWGSGTIEDYNVTIPAPGVGLNNGSRWIGENLFSLSPRNSMTRNLRTQELHHAYNDAGTIKVQTFAPGAVTPVATVTVDTGQGILSPALEFDPEGKLVCLLSDGTTRYAAADPTSAASWGAWAIP